MSRVVVTGGAGYIGEWLAVKLKSLGQRVRIVDVVNPSYEVADFVKANVRRLGIMLKAFSDCECVYHLAAVVSKLRASEDRWNAIETNIIGTLNVLEACRKLDIPRLVNISTSEVVGEPIYQPTDEKHPRNPKTTYGTTKCCAEDLCREYASIYGMNVVIPRLFMVYGAEDWREIKYHSAIAKFVALALQDKQPTAYADCVRVWMHVTDCVDALALLQKRGERGEIYDITNPPDEKISMVDLAKWVIRLCEKNLEPIIKEAPVWDTKAKIANGNKAYKALKWKPKKSLLTELPAFIKNWKDHLGVKL